MPTLIAAAILAAFGVGCALGWALAHGHTDVARCRAIARSIPIEPRRRLAVVRG